jgi:hypothetical protein
MKIEISKEQVEKINEALAEEGADPILTKIDFQEFINRLIANYLGEV